LTPRDRTDNRYDRRVNEASRRPAPWPVRNVVSADVSDVVAMLVRAFADDPIANFMFAGSRRRARGLHSFFRTQLRRQYLPEGHVYTTDGCTGAALWGPPERVRHPLFELVQLLPTAPFLASAHIHRAFQLLFEVDGLHPKEPHWYLATLGTEPSMQGKGIGSALLADVLARADATGVPAYLESSKETNVPFYARSGFEVIGEVRVPGSPTLWRMWRDPR
jgi:GNAT superfamily N-acetyltransferase